MTKSSNVPPQAYTREILAQAYDWLKNQPSDVKSQAQSADMLVSLFLHSQRHSGLRNGPKRESESVKTFKNDLKGLASDFGVSSPLPKSTHFDLHMPNEANKAKSQRELSKKAKSLQNPEQVELPLSNSAYRKVHFPPVPKQFQAPISPRQQQVIEDENNHGDESVSEASPFDFGHQLYEDEQQSPQALAAPPISLPEETNPRTTPSLGSWRKENPVALQSKMRPIYKPAQRPDPEPITMEPDLKTLFPPGSLSKAIEEEEQESEKVLQLTDEQLIVLVEKICDRFHLSDPEQALKMLISVGYEHLMKVFPQ